MRDRERLKVGLYFFSFRIPISARSNYDERAFELRNSLDTFETSSRGLRVARCDVSSKIQGGNFHFVEGKNGGGGRRANKGQRFDAILEHRS